jgi:hypothetical protein
LLPLPSGSWTFSRVAALGVLRFDESACFWCAGSQLDTNKKAMSIQVPYLDLRLRFYVLIDAF